MVTRRVGIILGISAPFFLLLVCLAWLLGTSSGVAWLFGRVSAWTPVQIHAADVDGRLAGRLHIQNLQVAWPGGGASALQFGWQFSPGALMTGTLQVAELTAQQVVVELPPAEEKLKTAEPSGPLDLSWIWTTLPDWTDWLDLHVESLRLDSLQIRQGDEDVFVLQSFACGLDWAARRLNLNVDEITLPLGSASGSVVLNADQKNGEIQIAAQLAKPWREINSITTAWTLTPLAERQLQGEGNITLGGVAGPQAKADARLVLEPQRLLVKQLHAVHLTRPDRLDVSGELAWESGDLIWKSLITAKDLDLNDWNLALQLTGKVDGHGVNDHYRGHLDVVNADPSWVVERLAGDFDGDSAHVVLTSLDGGLLQGAVNGSGQVDWLPLVRIQADLQGRQLNPGYLVKDLEATVNADVTGDWVWDTSGDHWQLKADLLPSDWRGHQVHGQVQADGQWADVRIENLLLQGAGLLLHAAGSLAERLEFDLQATDLSPWWPNLSGNAAANGWLQWRERRPAGEVQGRIGQLVFNDMQLEQLEVRARLEGLLEEVDLHLRGAGFIYGEEELQQVAVDLTGSQKHHQGTLDLVWPSGNLHGAVTGSLDDDVWNGQLAGLDIREKGVGNWSLRQPASVILSQHQLRVPNLELNSDQAEEIDLIADLKLNPLAGTTSAKWRQLNLEGFNPWLSFMSLSGVSSGDARAQWRPQLPPVVETQMHVQSVIELADGRIPIDEGILDLTWGDDGLVGYVSLDLGSQGEVFLEASASGPVCFGCPPRSRLLWEWDKLDLALFNPWLPVTLTGGSCGKVDVTLEKTELAMVNLSATASFNLEEGEFSLTDADLKLSGNWDPAGLHLNAGLSLADGGSVDLQVTSADRPRWGMPPQGTLQGDWSGLQLALAQAWLPPTLQLVGDWEGEVQGGWQDGGTLQLELDSLFNKGELSWQDMAGELMATDLNGRLQGRWGNEGLSAVADINLSRQGRLSADVSLPLSNRFPFPFASHSPWQGHVALQGRESGLLTAMLPGLVEDTKGRLDLQVEALGTPADPRFSGSVSLQEASGTLPALGIRLDDVELEARFAGQQLRIERLSLVSGKGNLQGEATLELDGWLLKKQTWSLRGKDMPLIKLPELELVVSPDLTGEGTAQELTIRGSVLIPQLMLRSLSGQGQQPVQTSPDVVVVDAGEQAGREWPFKLDAQIRLDLGDHVLINTAGVDARLTGGVSLKLLGPQDMTGTGEISVAQGTYAGYGLRLPIERGRVLFSGGPLDRPTLDVLALRKIGEVKAGVKVTGTPRQPVVQLYSDPSMPDTDKLSYIVLGRPLGAEGGQADVLMLAAGALLSQGESAALQDTLQRRLGIDIKVNAGDSDVANSVISIGKYLRPDLYVSLGYSVFTQTNEVRLRYNLSESWELQSNMGVESGADLYYRVDFE